MSQFHVCLKTALIAYTLMLAGCNLAPDYQRPSGTLPASWGSPELAHTSGLNAQTFFQDDSLRSLIALTGKNNHDLRASLLNLEKARVQYGVERLSALPALNASVGKTAAHEPAGIFDTIDTGAVTYQQYDAKLTIASWEPDFWGRLRNAREAALDQFLAADASARALRISLTTQAVSAWLTWLGDRDSLTVTEKRLANQQTLLLMNQQSLHLGNTSQQDLLNAEAAVRDAETELAQTKRQLQMDYNNLRLLVGTELPATLTGSITLQHEWGFPVLEAGLPSEVLMQRPDIISAEYQLRAANANIGVARAAFFPSVVLTAEGGSSSADLAKLFSGGTGAWSFMPSITLPIFNGGRNQANLDIAELNKKIEIINYEKAIQQAFRDVSDALVSQTTLRMEMNSRERELAIIQQQYHMAEMSYQAGAINKMELLQQQQALLQKKTIAINARLRYLLQSVQLFAVLGGDKHVT